MYTLYKIYFGETLAYLGRTRQPLKKRLRGHFFKARLHKAIDIFQVTHIECAHFPTCADMYLYEIYYINKLHPLLNRDDVAPDELTIQLPEVPFEAFDCDLMDKWKAGVTARKEAERERRRLGREKRKQTLAAKAKKEAS